MNLRLPFLLMMVAMVVPLMATPDSWKEDIWDPKYAFSSAFNQMLNFEQASIETTLRGFIAIGDSSPGYSGQKASPPQLPSRSGMKLNVAICEDTTKNSDVIEKKDGLIHRKISILSPVSHDPSYPSLEIEWIYGEKVNPDIIHDIDRLISKLKKSAQVKPDSTPRFDLVSLPPKARVEILSALIFEEMDFKDQTLQECLRQLSDRTSDSIGKGISSFIRLPANNPEPTKLISMKLRQMTFHDILELLSDASGANIEMTEGGIFADYGKPQAPRTKKQ